MVRRKMGPTVNEPASTRGLLVETCRSLPFEEICTYYCVDSSIHPHLDILHIMNLRLEDEMNHEAIAGCRYVMILCIQMAFYNSKSLISHQHIPGHAPAQIQTLSSRALGHFGLRERKQKLTYLCSAGSTCPARHVPIVPYM